ncbi:MAG: MarR family transcriptional regulator [Spirochaetes bacterium]|jgi:DNA-binding MarR family transcriptional regulator|nr:MarR family transcriptional regulator [Spirochaetota bacterium]
MKNDECKIKPEQLHCCLFFTANTLARAITVMAEEEFGRLGMSPTHAFLVMLVNGNPGITPKELSRELNLAPSTVTRLIDLVESRGYVSRESDGRPTLVYPTESGKAIQKTIIGCWKNLHERYSSVLGQTQGERLTRMLDETAAKLGTGK